METLVRLLCAPVPSSQAQNPTQGLVRWIEPRGARDTQSAGGCWQGMCWQGMCWQGCPWPVLQVCSQVLLNEAFDAVIPCSSVSFWLCFSPFFFSFRPRTSRGSCVPRCPVLLILTSACPLPHSVRRPGGNCIFRLFLCQALCFLYVTVIMKKVFFACVSGGESEIHES